MSLKLCFPPPPSPAFAPPPPFDAAQTTSGPKASISSCKASGLALGFKVWGLTLRVFSKMVWGHKEMQRGFWKNRPVCCELESSRSRPSALSPAKCPKLYVSLMWSRYCCTGKFGVSGFGIPWQKCAFTHGLLFSHGLSPKTKKRTGKTATFGSSCTGSRGNKGSEIPGAVPENPHHQLVLK